MQSSALAESALRQRHLCGQPRCDLGDPVVLSSKVPSLCRNTTLPNLSCRDASGVFLSLLKKRGIAQAWPITRSLPEITSEGDRLSILDTVTKAGSKAPVWYRSGENFWWLFIAEMKPERHLETAHQTLAQATGHSTRPVTSSRRSSASATASARRPMQKLAR